MTAATSTKNKSYFGKRFFNRFAESRKLFVVNTVFSLLGLPLLTLIYILVRYYEERNHDIYSVFSPDGYLMLGAVCLFASFAMGLIIALNNFRYLYQKQLVDMNYSLPLNSKERFFADYLSGLVSYLVPIACGTIISFIIAIVGETNLREKIITPNLVHFTSSGVIVVVGLIMLYTFSVLGIVFAGSTFEAVFSIVAINAMIPATIACLWLAMISSASFGINEDSIIRSIFLTSTSPIGVGIFFGDVFSDGSFIVYGRIGGENTNAFYFRGLICAVIVTIAALFLAYFLYKKRKAEDVSKPYVFKGYYYAILVLAVFCILSLFISQDENVLPGLIICAVGWFLMELITRRGFKKFWTAGLGFALTVGVVFGACALCKATNGFGAAKKIPAASAVKSVSVYSYSSNGFSGFYDVVITDPEAIQAVVNLHKEVVDRHFNPDNYDYEVKEFEMDDENQSLINIDDTITIEYNMKSGNKLSRRYTIVTSMESELLEEFLLSDDYAKAASDNMYLEFANSAVNGEYWFRTCEEAEKNAKNGYASVLDKFNVKGVNLNLDKNDMKALSSAYRSDLESMTREELEAGNIYCNIGSNWVLDSFDNTKAVLDDLGYEAPEFDKAYIESNLNNRLLISDDVTLVSYLSENITEEPLNYDYSRNIHTMNIEKAMTSIGNSYRSFYDYGGSDGYYLNLSSEESYLIAEQLLEEASTIIINEKPAAVIRINSMSFYVKDTAENQNLIEELMAS